MDGVIYLGIDPGTTGGLAMLTSKPEWRCEVRDLPTYAVKGKFRTNKHVDPKKLNDLLLALVPKGFQVKVIIEDVFTIPGMNTAIKSSDSLVESRVTCENACRMHGWTVDRVRPQQWQAFYGLKGGDKRLSLGVAQRLYPLADLKLVKDHNKAEAVLIAHWKRRQDAEALSR
jgi:Holliday junction resolvasome RuvABC endonuclease subunit